MSAAATAAGYLYASGRLRGRQSKDENGTEKPKDRHATRDVRVAVYQPPSTREAGREAAPETKPAEPRRQPKIEYRTRRWKPE